MLASSTEESEVRDPWVMRMRSLAGHPAYGIGQLREDLERFVFLLGGSDGEPLFGRPPH